MNKVIEALRKPEFSKEEIENQLLKRAELIIANRSAEKEVIKPMNIDLDQTDMLLVENSVLKEQNESYRNSLKSLQLNNEGKALHSYFVNKYKINLNTSTFSIESGKTLIITPK